MRIRQFFLCLFLCGSLSLFPDGESYNSSAFVSGLNGHPEQVVTTVTFATELPAHTEENLENYIVDSRYNPAGIRTGEKMFSKNGELIGSSVFHFSPDGNIREIEYLDQYNNLISRIVYTYNDRNNWKTAVVYRGGFAVKEEIRYYYSPEGRLTGIEKLDALGIPSEYEKLGYNEDGKVSEKTFYGSGKKLKSMYRFSYDSAGNLTGYTRRNNQGRITETYSALYSPDNRLLNARQQQMSDGYTVETAWSYDSYGNPTEKSVYNPQISSAPTVYRYLYHYDSHHNWIEKNIYINGIFYESIVKVIRYYPETGR